MTISHLSSARPDDHDATVIIEGDAVLLDGFRETDRRVYEAVSGAPDPDQMVHRILELGARCVSDTSTVLQTQAVAAEVDRLTSEISSTVTAATEAISAAAAALVGEGGAIPSTFSSFRADLAILLEGLFDEDSKSSVLAKLDTLLATHQASVQASLDAQLDLNQPASPLARSREDVLEKLEEHGGRIVSRLDEMATDLAVKKARAAESERGTGKGREFEKTVFAEIQARVNPLGDIAEHLGDEYGAVPGSKVGDVVVALDPDDASGRPVRYVVEAKDKNVNSLPKMLAEMDEALANREAVVAVAVFSSQANAPTKSPLESFGAGTKLIVVAEKDEDGDLTREGITALRLACTWARLMAIRMMRAEADSAAIDVDLIEEALGRARQALAGAKAIRTAHSKARRGIEEAGSHLSALCDGVEEALRQMAEELRRPGGEGS